MYTKNKIRNVSQTTNRKALIYAYYFDWKHLLSITMQKGC